MALFSVGFLGTAILGGPLAGFVTQHSVSGALLIMGLGCVAGAALSVLLTSGLRFAQRSEGNATG